MKFASKLAEGILIRRYKRFLADIELPSGQVITVHCPNTGSMRNCMLEGSPIWYSRSDSPKRKYPHTWEIATTPTGDLAGINSARANALVREAMEGGKISKLSDIRSVQAEVPYGSEGSRIDFLVQLPEVEYFVEVKSVTLCEGEGHGFFPGSVSLRASKHLREMTRLVKEGKKALLIYCVQHSGITQVAPARHIDELYAKAFDEAILSGVEVLALRAKINPEEITLQGEIPVIR